MTSDLERTLLLSRHVNAHAIHSLLALLPPPFTDDPADRVRRDSAAVAQLAAMAPVNAEETALAVAIAATTAHACDALRAASLPGADQAQCLAQCVSMLRQASGSRSLFLRMQAVRVKRDANPAAADAAAWTEHYALDDMLQAIGRQPNGEPVDGPEIIAPASSHPGALAEARSSEQSMLVPETIYRLSGNETPVRFGQPMSSTKDVADPTLSVCSDSETKSRSTGNETAVRLGQPTSSTKDVVDPTPAVCSVSETESRLSGNETPARFDQRASISKDMADSLRAVCSDYETKSRSTGNETPVGLGQRASSTKDVADTTRTLGSGSETQSQSTGNETLVRLGQPAPSTKDVADTRPAACSHPETKSRSTGNETDVRLGSPASAVDAAESMNCDFSRVETTSRSTCNETQMRHVAAAFADGGKALPSVPLARAASPYETVARSTCNEMPMRLIDLKVRGTSDAPVSPAGPRWHPRPPGSRPAVETIVAERLCAEPARQKEVTQLCTRSARPRDGRI